MKKSTLLFVTILISFFPFGDLFAKGKVKVDKALEQAARQYLYCLLYTSPSPRDP